MATTAERLRQLMAERDLKQADILRHAVGALRYAAQGIQDTAVQNIKSVRTCQDACNNHPDKCRKANFLTYRSK